MRTTNTLGKSLLDKRPFDENCPIFRAAEIVGDKCTLMILRDLLRDDACKFSDFNANDRGFSMNTVSNRLKKLESTGLVRTDPYQSHPPRFEYRLTSKGKKLGPILESMFRWGKTQR